MEKPPLKRRKFIRLQDSGRRDLLVCPLPSPLGWAEEWRAFSAEPPAQRAEIP